MGSVVAERKKGRRAEKRPKPEIRVEKATFLRLPLQHRRHHKDGTWWALKYDAVGKESWICVDWRSELFPKAT